MIKENLVGNLAISREEKQDIISARTTTEKKMDLSSSLVDKVNDFKNKSILE